MTCISVAPFLNLFASTYYRLEFSISGSPQNAICGKTPQIKTGKVVSQDMHTWMKRVVWQTDRQNRQISFRWTWSQETNKIKNGEGIGGSRGQGHALLQTHDLVFTLLLSSMTNSTTWPTNQPNLWFDQNLHSCKAQKCQWLMVAYPRFTIHHYKHAINQKLSTW